MRFDEVAEALGSPDNHTRNEAINKIFSLFENYIIKKLGLHHSQVLLTIDALRYRYTFYVKKKEQEELEIIERREKALNSMEEWNK